VVLAFRQGQQRDVDAWLSWAITECDVPARPVPGPTACYEVPMLGRRWRLGRRVIDGGMASSIGDPVVLARTVTVYTDVSAALAPLDVEGFDTVRALVVSAAGDVHAHEVGPPGPQSRTRVRAALFPAG
jgi:hypothetical protein